MGGVDLLLQAGQPPVAAGVAVETAPALRNPDRWPTTLVSGVGHRPDPGGVQRVDQAVLAGGAHVMTCAGKRGRGPHQATDRVGQDLHVHPVPLVFPE